MTILIIGSGEAASKVAGALEAYHHPVQRCRTASMAVPLLEHDAERYALILAEDVDDSQVLARHVAQQGLSPPIVVIGERVQGQTVHPGAAPMCSIRRSADGCHQLRCALSEANAQPGSHPGLAQALEDQPVAFAYSAPATQRR